MSHVDLWGKVRWREGRAHRRPGTTEEYRGSITDAEPVWVHMERM